MLCCCTIIIIIIIYSRQQRARGYSSRFFTGLKQGARASARVLCRRNIICGPCRRYTKWARAMHARIYGYEYILIGINIKTDARAFVLFYTRRRSRRQTFTFQYILRSTRAHACFFFLNNFIFLYFFFCCCGGSKQNQFITITFELRQHDFKI